MGLSLVGCYDSAVTERSDDARRQDALLRATLILTSELSLPAVLQKIIDLATEVVDSRYGALGVVGPGGRILEFVTHGVTEEERRRIGHLPEGHGILGALIKDARPLRLRRIQDDARSGGFPPNHPPMTSFLGVPIAIRGRVFGNLYLTEKRDADEFTPSDEDAAVKLAAQAAVAVENARLYHEAQMGQRFLTAVNEVAQAILAGQDVEVVLRLIARHARALVGAKVATVAIPRGGDGELVVRVADGDFGEELEGMVFAANRSVSGAVMRTGEPLALADAAADRRVHQPMVRVGKIGPALFVPLGVKGRTFATLAVGNHPGERPFTNEDLEVVGAFASQAAVALEHARIVEELQRLALVEDRERIAKELHDDVIQSLFAEGMALQASLARLNDTAAMETRITQAVEHIDRVIRDLRNYIFGLRPGAVADRQLDRSLRELAADFEESGALSIGVRADPDVASRLTARSADITQAAREAISNAVRHSGGDRIEVALFAIGDAAVLEVADNGKGFDIDDAARRGQGLGNLRERTEALGGRLLIESASGQGTLVRITIPL